MWLIWFAGVPLIVQRRVGMGGRVKIVPVDERPVVWTVGRC